MPYTISEIIVLFLHILLLAGYGKQYIVRSKIIIMNIVAFCLAHIVQSMDSQLLQS